jgi:hypothetical protein
VAATAGSGGSLHLEHVDLPTGTARISRALAADTRRVLRFVETSVTDHWPDESADSWLGETAAALANRPPTCFVAVQERNLLGFACFDATAKGYFGPTGVLREHQQHGVGHALLLDTLHAMRYAVYGYAIIGWPARSAAGFYEHTVNAWPIPGSSPGIYQRLIDT